MTKLQGCTWWGSNLRMDVCPIPRSPLYPISHCLPNTRQVWMCLSILRMSAWVGTKLAVYCVALLVSLSIGEAPRPRGSGEPLEAAGAAAAAVLARAWQPHCCVILLTDGAASTHAVTKGVEQLPAPWGATVLETRPAPGNSNRSVALLGEALSHALRVRRASWCVVVVVVSDNIFFLVKWAELGIESGLLAWPTRVVAITGLPTTRLHRIHLAYSHANSVVVVSNGNTPPRCTVWVHQPFSPPNARAAQVASWSPLRGLSLVPRKILFPDKFHKLAWGPTLVVAAEEYPPHVLISDTGPGQDYVLTGPMEKLLRILSTQLNFTYTIKRPPDGSWGVLLEDGSWTGMVGMVNRKEADMGLGPFAVTTIRATAVDYTRTILVDYGRILAGSGKPEVDPWGFLLPFTPDVWLAFLAAMGAALAAIAFLASCAAPRLVAPTSWLSGRTLMYMRVVLQQDVSARGMRWWERLVLGAWMVLTLVLMRSYAGTLMSLLAVRQIPQPFQDLRRLLDDPDVTMVWEAGSMYVQFLMAVTSGIFREVREAESLGRLVFVKTTDYNHVLDQMVRRGTHAFVGEYLSSRVLMANDFSASGQCDFYASRAKFLPFMFAMVGRRYSPLVPALSARIGSVTEAGLYDSWLDAAIPNDTSCVAAPTKVTVTSSLGLVNLWGMFTMLGSGAAVAGLALVGEVLAGHL
ncbi:probable glutamate receptor [Portunus trituberculatus]|uniref:probable glutamate receptor n=1 Tax=Portunus trituberculatus TaxID=210409 RepID=UPI001E1CF688|nr:probable glutamate receptor [Portunus trituberculatus]